MSIGSGFERFLRGPVPVVLVVLWLAGVALLLVGCALVPYFLWAMLA